MSYHVFFDFSTGLSKRVRVPKGYKETLLKHVNEVEQTLKIKTEQYEKNPPYWDVRRNEWKGISDKVLCETVSAHNTFVRRVYKEMGFWFKHPFLKGKGHADESVNRAWTTGWKSEWITPQEAQGFWRGLTTLTVPIWRWTPEYYIERMEHLYEVMRGRDNEGVSFDQKPLTVKQAAQVVNLFSEFLDNDDRRLDVPNGHDYLASSYDGGYVWCEKCGPAHPDDAYSCSRRKCPVMAEQPND